MSTTPDPEMPMTTSRGDGWTHAVDLFVEELRAQGIDPDHGPYSASIDALRAEAVEAVCRGFDEHLKLARRKFTTRKSYRAVVSRYLRDHQDPWGRTVPEIERWLGGTGWTVETQRKACVTLRQLFRWAQSAGIAGEIPALVPMEHGSGPAPVSAPSGWIWPIDAWCGWLAAGGKAPTTIRVRRSVMKRAARELGPDPWTVTTAELVAWLGSYAGAASGRKGLRDTVRSFYLWAADAGHVDVSPAATLPSIHVPVGIPRPAPTPAVLAAIEAADDRTRLAIYLGVYAGLRRMEIAKVHTSDVRGATLYVVGKGGKHRQVPIHPVLADDLEATIRRMSVLGERYDGWLFPSSRGGHLDAGTIARLICRVLPDGWTTHTLRHRFASQAYANGGRDLRAVQELLGHSKPETTARYTAVPDGALTAAVAGVGL